MPRPRSRRRWLIAGGIGLVVLAWLVACGLTLLSARREAQSGLDPMTGAPARADDAQLADLGIAVIVPEEDEDA